MNPIIYVLPHDSFAYAMLNPMAAARTSCYLSPPPPLFNHMNSTFNHHVGLTTTCTSSALSPLMNSNLLASSLSDANMMNAHLMDNPMIKPSIIEEKDLDAMIIESSNKVGDEPMLRLDVNDMLTSWEDLFNDCSKGSNSPTSSTRSCVSTFSSSPSTMDAYESSSCHSSGEEFNSPQSVDATNIRIQLQSNTNVYNNKKIGKPDVLKPKRKSVVVTFEDSKKIQMINKSRYREKKSRKRLKYPGESSLNLWKWMD